jgi:hypothetical protein
MVREIKMYGDYSSTLAVRALENKGVPFKIGPKGKIMFFIYVDEKDYIYANRIISTVIENEIENLKGETRNG